MEVNAHKLRHGQTRFSSYRPSLPSRRRRQPPWRLVGAAAVPLVLLGVVGYVARRRVFQGIALLAKAVEEGADTIEDAAEDLAEAAQAKAKHEDSGE
jgi:hypothetical protein